MWRFAYEIVAIRTSSWDSVSQWVKYLWMKKMLYQIKFYFYLANVWKMCTEEKNPSFPWVLIYSIPALRVPQIDSYTASFS